MTERPSEHAEWLEADGLGGFASGTAALVRTRRYHALLLSARTPPTGRQALVNGVEAHVTTPGGTAAISAQRYGPGVVYPDGQARVVSFEPEPWPAWTFRLGDGTRIRQEVFVRHGSPLTVASWRLLDARPGVTLRVRPLMSGRDYHSSHSENGTFRFEPRRDGNRLVWRAYDGVQPVVAVANARYEHGPVWYRNFQYDDERERGLDCREDLASPGTFVFDLSRGEAALILCADESCRELPAKDAVADAAAACLRAAEQWRRGRFSDPLDRAVDSYLVKREDGKTIVAGYPWFTDWGRDTFIALRGLCLATGRLEDARQILVQWAGAVSEGMLPNRFVDHGEQAEFNSVDASLWYGVAVHEFLAAMEEHGRTLPESQVRALKSAVEAIVSGYAAGTRYGIRMDDDGLLACGTPGVQLTWMDAKVGDWVVTPRIGKPVEVQALWVNALWVASQWKRSWASVQQGALRSFREKFWNEERGCLFDVVDADHKSGVRDAALRPNQVFAVGGLPLNLLGKAQAWSVVDAVERELLTPVGLRSLSPREPGYRGRYEGGVRERDGAYHQGTVWPWLMGAFVEAWLRVRGSTSESRAEARERFLPGLMENLGRAGLGHVCEIADGDAPHTPRGCPFQAWSLGELLRLTRVVLPGPRQNPKTTPKPRALSAATAK